MRGCLGVSKFCDWRSKKFEDYIRLIPRYSSRQIVEKCETCTCVAAKFEIQINLTCVCPCVVVIWEEVNQLDATQCFIELGICSTCFGHVYAHHQGLATVLLVYHVACSSWLLLLEGQVPSSRLCVRNE